MSISSSGNESETAVAQANVDQGTEVENAAVLEASEDRAIQAVTVSLTNGNLVAELGFSNRFKLNQAEAQDDIASGVLASIRGSTNANNGDTVTVYMPEGHEPLWDAGEELNLHLNNFTANSQQVRVVVYYTPLGEFQRDRLRNR